MSGSNGRVNKRNKSPPPDNNPNPKTKIMSGGVYYYIYKLSTPPDNIFLEKKIKIKWLFTGVEGDVYLVS